MRKIVNVCCGLILLRSFGRSGSTVLMSTLKEAFDVYVPGKIPYEERHAAYLTRMATAVLNSKTLLPRDAVFSDLDLIGGNPFDGFEKLSEASLRKSLLEAFLQSVESFEYYAEKIPLDLAPKVNEVIEAKNILLVRDPRAELNSILKFNKKRKIAGFGFQSDVPTKEELDSFILQKKQFFGFLLATDDSDRRLTLRYEDYVLNPSETILKISVLLGKKNYTDISQLTLGDKNHMTSLNAKASTDCWKTELPESLATMLTRALEPELNGFKYDV